MHALHHQSLLDKHCTILSPIRERTSEHVLPCACVFLFGRRTKAPSRSRAGAQIRTPERKAHGKGAPAPPVKTIPKRDTLLTLSVDLDALPDLPAPHSARLNLGHLLNGLHRRMRCDTNVLPPCCHVTRSSAAAGHSGPPRAKGNRGWHRPQLGYDQPSPRPLRMTERRPEKKTEGPRGQCPSLEDVFKDFEDHGPRLCMALSC